MDNQALTVLVAVVLFGAMAIGVISMSDQHHNAHVAPRYSSNYDPSNSSN